MEIIRNLALVLSLLGSILVAMPTEMIRFLGFTAWIVSNGIWLVDAKGRVDKQQMIMFGFFFLTATLGAYNNWG